jgi:hypothetical protein
MPWAATPQLLISAKCLFDTAESWHVLTEFQHASKPACSITGICTVLHSPRSAGISTDTCMVLACCLQLCPSIAQLSKLRWLDLSHNAAMGTNAQASLPSGLAQLEALQALNLDGCGLASVPHAVLALPNLQQLSLKASSHALAWSCRHGLGTQLVHVLLHIQLAW